MRKIFYPKDKDAIEGHHAATIGFFDGVHRGHHFLIEQLKEIARKKGLRSMVITFERHPRQVLQSAWQPQLLSSLTERMELLEATGIDTLVVLRFDKAMAGLTARDFMSEVLHTHLHVETLLTGYDNRFGHDRTEGFTNYVAYGQELGIEVMACTPYDVAGIQYTPHDHSGGSNADDNQQKLHVSSSLVRRLLTEGNVSQAARCLDRPYTLTGTVVHGEQIGRTIGFPTANIKVADRCRLIPANGVYAVNVQIAGRETVYRGMMNIGMRPTFEGHRQTLEVNIFDFNGDIYDNQVTVSFLMFLRQEQTFDSPEELKKQMEQDALRARTLQ